MICPFLIKVEVVATGRSKLTCDWCNSGVMRECNCKDILKDCPLDKYGRSPGDAS